MLIWLTFSSSFQRLQTRMAWKSFTWKKYIYVPICFIWICPTVLEFRGSIHTNLQYYEHKLAVMTDFILSCTTRVCSQQINYSINQKKKTHCFNHWLFIIVFVTINTYKKHFQIFITFSILRQFLFRCFRKKLFWINTNKKKSALPFSSDCQRIEFHFTCNIYKSENLI